MKSKSVLKDRAEPAKTRISLRLDEGLAVRFDNLVGASRRTKTSVIEQCLEEMLPKLEKQYGR